MPKKDKGAKGGKEKKTVAEEPQGEAAAAGPWVCTECGQENEETDELCCACEEPRPKPKTDDPFAGYVVGVILSAQPVPNKDKLRVVEVNVGGPEPLKIVTNAPNVKADLRVVVATVGSRYRGESGEAEVVQKGNVGGVTSFGMLCNGPMLGWKGGDNKAAATLPDDFEVGSTPPLSRPRKE